MHDGVGTGFSAASQFPFDDLGYCFMILENAKRPEKSQLATSSGKAARPTLRPTVLSLQAEILCRKKSDLPAAMPRRLVPAVLAAVLLCPPPAVAQDCKQDPDGFEDAEANFEVNCASEDVTVTHQPDGEVPTAKLQVRKKEGEGTGLTYKITMKESSHVVVVPSCLFSPALDAGVRL